MPHGGGDGGNATRPLSRDGSSAETQQSGQASRSEPEIKDGRVVPKMVRRKGSDARPFRRRPVRFQTIVRRPDGRTPRGICLAISTHLTGEGRGLNHYEKAARRWCS